MFEIRAEQIVALEAAQIDFFASSMEKKIKALWPEHCKDYTIVDVAVSIDLAKSFGLRSCIDVSSFILLYFGLGEGFVRHPAIYSVLSSAKVDAEAKIPYLISSMSDLDWAVATQPSHRILRDRV